MADKLKVKLLVVVWGDRYVEEFAHVALPSYLAPGNLPVLAAETDFEILVMTTQESRRRFEEDPAFARVRELCPMRYIYIDDLITIGMYGVTLTLAFARGIMDSGDAQTDTHFVFANSDFFLAEGSYRTLLRRMQRGEGCIMAPSLRAIAESVLPVLAAETQRGGGVLSMAPRDMVRLTLDNLHPTVVGKTVTSEFASCATHNQIYWQVDATTMLARYHLIFMLAIKPEVPLSPINSYCDYGFVPEMVPSGKFTIMDDSDDFFMLETQALAQERDLVRGGARSVRQIARHLTEWTTKEHRAFAEVDVVFHTEDLPANLGEAKQQLAAYMRRLKSYMGAPKDHVQHIYWALGFQAWLSKVDPRREKPLPPEAADPLVRKSRFGFHGFGLGIGRRVRDFYVKTLSQMQEKALRRPMVPIWHHLWPDFRHLRKVTNAMLIKPGSRNLFICGRDSLLASYYASLPTFDVVYVEDLLSDEAPLIAKGRYDSLLLHLYRADVRKTRAVFDLAERRLLKTDAQVAVLVEHLNSETDASDFRSEIAFYIEDVLPSHWTAYRIKAYFVGGYVKRWLRIVERRIFRYLLAPSMTRLPFVFLSVLMWPLVALMTTANSVRYSYPSSFCPPYCSSFFLSIEKFGKRTGDA